MTHAGHDLLVLELLKRKHARPGISIAVTALVAMKGQRYPLEQLAQVLDVAIEYLDTALGDAVPGVVEQRKTDIAFADLVGGIQISDPFDPLTATDDPRATTQGDTP